MKLFAPKYYTQFKCIAEKCTHSCCIGWEIDIDSDTYDKYKNLTGNLSSEIANSIDDNGIPHFKLTHDRCPHLSESGLCNIITSLGHDYLCEICREHPRFYNYTAHGCEVGLGMACEEACRIILSSDDYNDLVEMGTTEGEVLQEEYTPLPCRKRIFDILCLCLPYENKLDLICKEFNVSLDNVNWNNVISKLEYLDPAHKDLFSAFSIDAIPKDHKKLERAFAYFVYRHCTQAYDEQDFRCSLGFCLFCERLLRSTSNLLDSCELACRIISEELEYSTDNTDIIKEKFL